MLVGELIELLEEIDDKEMPVELVIGSYSTDHMWIDIIDGKVFLGTS